MYHLVCNRSIHVQVIGFEIYAYTTLYQAIFLGPLRNQNAWEGG